MSERLQQFFVLNNVTEAKNIASLLTFIGPETYSILKKLLFSADWKYVELVKVLKQHFAPEINTIAKRYKFHREDQVKNQSLSEYIVQLKARAHLCKFDEFLNEALGYRLVFGVRNSQLRATLLKEQGLTFKKVCSIAVNWEMAEIQTQKEIVLYQFRIKEDSSGRHGTRSSDLCGSCGRRFDSQKCPALEWKCRKCGKYS